MPFERCIDGSRAAGTSEEKSFVAVRCSDRRGVLPFVVQRVRRGICSRKREYHIGYYIDARFDSGADDFRNASFGCGWVGL